VTVKPEQTNAFFRLMEQRYERVTTILTTDLQISFTYRVECDGVPLDQLSLERVHCASSLGTSAL
jgi:hypothetical protein